MDWAKIKMNLVKYGTKVRICNYPRSDMTWYGTIIDSSGCYIYGYKVSLYLSLRWKITEFNQIHWFKHDQICLVKKSEYENFDDLMKTQEILNA